MVFRRSRSVTADPYEALYHLANGEFVLFVDDHRDERAWGKFGHRGVQFLDKIEFPRKEKRYIFSPQFEIKYDTAFDETLAGCAAPREVGRPWISEELQEAYRRLHRLGYSHSYEAWKDGQLAGGCIGVQIGAWITCETMFHRVSNASKAAWGQTLVRLQERGFKWVDVAEVATHHVNYGETEIPQWKFDVMQRQEMKRDATIADGIPCRKLPLGIAMELEVMRVLRGVRRRLAKLTPQRLPQAVTPMVGIMLGA